MEEFLDFNTKKILTKNTNAQSEDQRMLH